MIKYVLVDLDGTITNSEEGVTKCIQYALHHYGIEVEDLKQLRKYIGPPITWSFADAGMPEDKVDEAIAKYRERYLSVGEYEAYIYEGVPQMLKDLRAAGKKLILATSKPLPLAKRVCEHFQVDVLMDQLCGAGSDKTMNQKWQVIDYILKDNNITDKSEVIMVGDTRFDVEGANINGIKTIGVLWGFGTRESLEKEGAAYIAETPEEVTKLICEL